METVRRRAVIVGSGLLARRLAELAPHCAVDVVGVASRRADQAGRPAAEVLGVPADGTVGPLDQHLRRDDIDVVLHAGPGGSALWSCFEACAEAGRDALTSSGLVDRWLDPAADEPARLLDATARRTGARLLGTGMFPGFLADALPMLLASTVPGQLTVDVTQTSDISMWSPGVLADEIGIGRPVEDRGQVLADYLVASARALAAGLGDELLAPVSRSMPVPADHDEQVGPVTAPAGTTAGFRYETAAETAAGGRIHLVWQSWRPGMTLGTDYTLRGPGGTSLSASVGPVDGYGGTASRLLWSAHAIASQPAGLLSVASLPIGRGR